MDTNEISGATEGLTEEQKAHVTEGNNKVADLLQEYFPAQPFFLMVKHDALKRTTVLHNKPLPKAAHMVFTWLQQDERAQEALSSEIERRGKIALEKLAAEFAEFLSQREQQK